MTLRVEVSIVPFGNEDNKKIIKVLNISNHGLDHLTREYDYTVEEDSYKQVDDKTLRIKHNRSDGAKILIEKALSSIERF